MSTTGLVLDGKGGTFCEHGNALENGTPGKVAGKSIIGVDYLSHLSKIGDVCPEREVVVLPQFEKPQSITEYLNNIVIHNDRDIVVVNNYVQPQLSFDGSSPTTKTVTFENNNIVRGDVLGGSALRLLYEVKIINKGSIIERKNSTDQSPNEAIEGVNFIHKDSILGNIGKERDLCRDIKTVILPKFDVPTSITDYLKTLGDFKDIDIEIFNNHYQPTLKFDGARPTKKNITFTNNNFIVGDVVGGPAILLEYNLKLVNEGTLIELNVTTDKKKRTAIEGIKYLTEDSILGTINTEVDVNPYDNN